MLVKDARVVVVPGTPGSPAVDERIVCPPTRPDNSPKPNEKVGEYMLLCVTPQINIGTAERPSYVTGAPVCTKVWVAQ